MERIQYFRIFGFLAFMGSVFLSTTFHYPAFTVSWFVIMVLFLVALHDEDSEMVILAFSALAYVPLELSLVLSDSLNKTPSSNKSISEFALLLVTFIIIELILAVIWISAAKKKRLSKESK